MRRRTLVLGALLGASGCTALPTSGPVRTQARRTQAQGPGAVSYTHLTLPTNREV